MAGHAKHWLGLGLAAILCSGCSRDDAERLGRICRKASEKIEGVSGGPHGKLACSIQALRGSIGDMSLDSRVAIRLRWDKLLADADLRAELLSPGVIRLQGNIASGLRQYALNIAQNTEGVTSVVDGMKPAP